MNNVGKYSPLLLSMQMRREHIKKKLAQIKEEIKNVTKGK